MKKLTLDQLDYLPGHIDRTNIKTLQKYLNKGVIADIGTCSGKSAVVMANAGATVLTCDLIHNHQVDDVIKGHKITFFNETSEEFAKHCPPLDGCFIDGVHGYEGVRLDIEGIVFKVKKGGYVLFHDCNLYSNTVGLIVNERNGIDYQFVEEVGGVTDPNAPGGRQGSMWVGVKI